MPPMFKLIKFPQSTLARLVWVSGSLHLALILLRVRSMRLTGFLFTHCPGFFRSFGNDINVINDFSQIGHLFVIYITLLCLYVLWREFRAWARFGAGLETPSPGWQELISINALFFWVLFWLTLHILGAYSLGFYLGDKDFNNIIFLDLTIKFCLILAPLQWLSQRFLAHAKSIGAQAAATEAQAIKKALAIPWKDRLLALFVLSMLDTGDLGREDDQKGSGTGSQAGEAVKPGSGAVGPAQGQNQAGHPRKTRQRVISKMSEQVALYIEEKGRATVDDLTARFSLRQRTCQRLLKGLVDQARIERKGTTSDVYYQPKTSNSGQG